MSEPVSFVHLSGKDHLNALVAYQDYVEAFTLPKAEEKVNIINNRHRNAALMWDRANYDYDNSSWWYRLWHPRPTFYDVTGETKRLTRMLMGAIEQQVSIRLMHGKIETMLAERDQTKPFSYVTSDREMCAYLQQAIELCHNK